nr:MAG TPA: hypothetical protein [Caudoviricetes sp.]
MEKETVLEIEFMPVWDKWAWRIVKQNEEILERCVFEDKNIGVYSNNFPEYSYSECILNIRGNVKEKDNLINLCTEDEKKEIEEKVRNINEKYGLKKRWRAEYSKNYFYINEMFKIKFDTESYWDIDNKRYENGNYFRTEQDAKEYMEYIKHKSLEWHERKEE